MKFSEKQIQDFIWSKREEFYCLLGNSPAFSEVKFNDDLSDITIDALLKNRINRKLERGYEKLESMELIGCEVPLEQASNSTIRADFLSTFPGNTGIGIVELKKSAQTERQAFTELLAYAQHLNTLFPGMTREDTVYVLISPMETRIARDAVIQTLIFDNRNIVALKPRFEDPDDIESLKLDIWIPTDQELTSFSNSAFNQSHFNVCKIVWEYTEGWWDASEGQSLSAGQVEDLNSVSALAAQHMEEAGIHGFAYCSQTWPELANALPLTNSLVLVGLNPYAVGGNKFLQRGHLDENEDVPPPQAYLPNLSQIIPGLSKNAKAVHQDFHYLEDLHSVWDSQLFRIGRDVVKAATQTSDGKAPLTDQGFMDWGTYQEQFLEDVPCNNFLVRPTGLVRQLYMDVAKIDYDLCAKNGVENHPVHGDFPHVGIDYLTAQYYFRNFIRRMMGADEDDW